jgi:3-methyladenine DNA glycosylase AlkD
MNNNLQDLENELEKLKNPANAKNLQRFFKTKKGEYGEGDIFWGIKVPTQRKIIKNYTKLSLTNLQKLITSPIHEKRLISLLILVEKFHHASEAEQKEIYQMYLKNTRYINNWDLVDLSAPKIVGAYLENKDKKILLQLSKSKNLWEKRIAVLATYCYIRQGQGDLNLEIAKILLHDKHDLIHKAVGWMLREVGNRCSKGKEEKFLRKYYKQMPRTMLRYAIEKFSSQEKKMYLSGII